MNKGFVQICDLNRVIYGFFSRVAPTEYLPPIVYISHDQLRLPRTRFVHCLFLFLYFAFLQKTGVSAS